MAGTRPVGMAAGPITYAEIDAYRRTTLADLSAWDVALIRRIDQTILPILNPAPDTKEVQVRGGKGIASRMLAGAAAHNEHLKSNRRRA